jgi:hypothetical protein
MKMDLFLPINYKRIVDDATKIVFLPELVWLTVRSGDEIPLLPGAGPLSEKRS